MKNYLVLITFLSLTWTTAVAQRLDFLTLGELHETRDATIPYTLISTTEGIHRGLKIIPLIPVFPKFFPSLVHVSGKELVAEKRALKAVNGDILLNKKVERTHNGAMFIFYIEQVRVTGVAAKIDK